MTVVEGHNRTKSLPSACKAQHRLSAAHSLPRLLSPKIETFQSFTDRLPQRVDNCQIISAVFYNVSASIELELKQSN